MLATVESDDECIAPTKEALSVAALFLDDAPYEPTMICGDGNGGISIEDENVEGYRVVEIGPSGLIRDYLLRDCKIIWQNKWRKYES